MVLAHSSWVILWLLPRTILTIDQEQIIKGKLDPIWSDYIASIADDYSEDLPPATEKRNRQKPTPKNEWSITGMGEAPYLAVIYAEQSYQHPDTLDFNTAGKSCGGAIITKDKVATLCACVASWWMFHLKEIWDPDGKDYRFSEYNIKSKYLHVAHTNPHFEPASLISSRIVANVSAIGRQKKCGQFIEAKGHPTEQQVIVVVLELQNPIDHPFPGQYIPWPPAPILHDSPDDSRGTLITFGTRGTESGPKTFFDDYGDELKLNITAVNYKIKKVDVVLCATQYSEFSQEIQDRSTCFHPQSAPKHELCQGMIGSPVVVGSNFHGLLSTPVGCQSKFGEIVVMDFVKEIQEHIENLVGGAILQHQNTIRPALWREAELPRGFVAYEEGIMGPTKEPQSSAVVHDLSLTLILCLIGGVHWRPLPFMFTGSSFIQW